MDEEPSSDPADHRYSVVWPTAWLRTDDASDLAPELAGWEDLREREKSLAITPGMPVLLSPDGTVDPLLDRYIRYSGFLSLGEATQKKYLRSLCRLLDLVHRRGRRWQEVMQEDVQDLYLFRTDSGLADGPGTGNATPIGQGTWNSQQAGLADFVNWAHGTKRLLVHGDPIARRALRAGQSGDEQGAPLTSGKDETAEPVKWFTSAAYRRFKQIGLDGYGADDLRDPGYRGRTGDRGLALADYGWQSGLRMAELNGLLLDELPDIRQDRLYYRGRVTGKGRKTRDYWVGHAALQRTLAYIETDRAESVERAKRRGRYDRAEGKIIVTRSADGRLRVEESWDPRHQPGQALALSRLTPAQRRRLYLPGEDGFPEPLQVWLTEGGVPSTESAFQAQFRAASRRCAAKDPQSRLKMTPHMLRHSFALHMLLALWHALRLRADAAGGAAEGITKLYGDQWTLVQQMLGHSSPETTRQYYLAPVQGLEITDLLNDEDLVGDTRLADTLVPRIAKRSRLVLALPAEATGGTTYPEDEPDDTELSGRGPTVGHPDKEDDRA